MNRIALAARIKAAFPDPGWPADKEASDAGEGDLDYEYIKTHCQGRKWSELTSEQLRWTSMDGWAFTDDALLYFLPAWMLDDLEQDWENVGRLGDHLEHLRQRIVAEFTAEQAELLCEVLLLENPRAGDCSPDELIADLLALQGKKDTREVWSMWDAD